MKLNQTEISSLEYFLTFYSRGRKYFRHNSNFHKIQVDSRRFTDSMIQETTISQGNSRRMGTITSQNMENVSMCHAQTQKGQIHLWKFPDCNGNPWCSPKFPDNSLTFCKNEGIFQIPDNSLILLIPVNPALCVDQGSKYHNLWSNDYFTKLFLMIFIKLYNQFLIKLRENLGLNCVWLSDASLIDLIFSKIYFIKSSANMLRAQGLFKSEVPFYCYS